MSIPRNERRFRNFGVAVLLLTFLVILAGGVVRSTGSGMGCPDWPKCFGRWIPPTTEAQLPPNWQHEFAKHHSCGQQPVFNAAQTWTEYINRLLGAVLGLASLGLLAAALPFWRAGTRLWPVLALAVLVLMGFQAWLGKKVVETCLTQNMVTVHMAVAFVIVGLVLVLLRFAGLRWGGPGRTASRLARGLLAMAVVLAFAQVLLGTQVREAVDAAADALGPDARAHWLDRSLPVFLVHRSASWLLAAVVGYLAWTLRSRSLKLAAGLVLAEMALGIVLAEGGLPPAAQPLHLLLGSLLVGSLMWQALLVWLKPAHRMESVSA